MKNKNQLALFDTSFEIPENLKALLLGSDKADFELGLQITKGLQLSLVDCLVFYIEKTLTEIPCADSNTQTKELIRLEFGGVYFILSEWYEYSFILSVFGKGLKERKEFIEKKICYWGLNDTAETMLPKLKSKTISFIKDNACQFSQLLKGNLE